MSSVSQPFFGSQHPSLRLVVTSHLNFLPHVVSILNRKISNQNATYCKHVFTLVIEINLGLAQLALKTNAFSECVNGVSQLCFKYKIPTRQQPELWFTINHTSNLEIGGPRRAFHGTRLRTIALEKRSIFKFVLHLWYLFTIIFMFCLKIGSQSDVTGSIRTFYIIYESGFEK